MLDNPISLLTKGTPAQYKHAFLKLLWHAAVIMANHTALSKPIGGTNWLLRASTISKLSCFIALHVFFSPLVEWLQVLF